MGPKRIQHKQHVLSFLLFKSSNHSTSCTAARPRLI